MPMMNGSAASNTSLNVHSHKCFYDAVLFNSLPDTLRVIGATAKLLGLGIVLSGKDTYVLFLEMTSTEDK